MMLMSIHVIGPTQFNRINNGLKEKKHSVSNEGGCSLINETSGNGRS